MLRRPLTRACTSTQCLSGLPCSSWLKHAAASGARQTPLSLTNMTTACARLVCMHQQQQKQQASSSAQGAW